MNKSQAFHERAVSSRRWLRVPRVELLESRRLLTSAWQNPVVPPDISGDEWVTPLDALILVNYLNANGGSGLDAVKPTAAPFYDTNGDNSVSPIDLLIVLNELNAGRPLIFVVLANDTAVGGGTNSDRITADPSLRGHLQRTEPRDIIFAGWDVADESDFFDISQLRSGNFINLSTEQITSLRGQSLLPGAHQLTLRVLRGLDVRELKMDFVLDPNAV